MRALGAIWGCLLVACGGSTTTAPVGADASTQDGAASDGGASDAPTVGDAGSCADLTARAKAAIVKTCTSSDECAVITVMDCCAVYTGIRKDAVAGYQSAVAAAASVCPPDTRGCGCQDHTETNEAVPQTQPPAVVVATCDNGSCTAHVQK